MGQREAGRPPLGRPAQHLHPRSKTNYQQTPREDQSHCPKGGGHLAASPGRPAQGRPDGPTWKPLKLRFGVKVKHNGITCFQPTLPAVTARTDLGRAINRSPIRHFKTHTIGALLFHLYFLEQVSSLGVRVESSLLGILESSEVWYSSCIFLLTLLI